MLSEYVTQFTLHSVEKGKIYSHRKIFRQNTYLVKSKVNTFIVFTKLPNSWFDEFFFFSEREFIVFPHCELGIAKEIFCESNVITTQSLLIARWRMMRIHGKMWFYQKKGEKNVLKTQRSKMSTSSKFRALKIAISRKIRLAEKFLNFYTAC